MAEERTPAQSARRYAFMTVTSIAVAFGLFGYARSARDAFRDLLVQKAIAHYEQKAADADVRKNEFEVKTKALSLQNNEYTNVLSELAKVKTLAQNREKGIQEEVQKKQQEAIDYYKKREEELRARLSKERAETLSSLTNQQKQAWTVLSNNLSNDFATKRDALEKKYLGKLQTLAEVSDISGLTSLERKLTLALHRDGLIQQGLQDVGQFYNKKINDSAVRLIGTTFKVANNYHVMLQLLNPTNQAPLQIHQYTYDASNDTNVISLSKTLVLASPVKSFLFQEGKSFVIVDYSKNEFERYEGEHKLMKGDTFEAMMQFGTNARDILRDFEVLYRRGPEAQ